MTINSRHVILAESAVKFVVQLYERVLAEQCYNDASNTLHKILAEVEQC